MSRRLLFHYLILSSLASLAALAGDGTPAATGPAASQRAEDALFEDLPIVEAASLHAQTLEEAPASVTVITAADIRRYGYRTLGEALASVRGFYLTYDRIYHYVGVRGFSLPGDYNTRFLVMLNGHPLTENIYASNGFFGQDFGLDMSLVQRIEIIRGPTSALYGSNGIFANVNIITRSPVDSELWRVSTENASFAEKKVSISSSMYLGRGANLLVAASVFNNGGQSLYFPQYNQPENNNGWTKLDGERGYHSFANLVWHNWNFTAYFNSREKQPPAAYSADAIFNNRGDRVQDRRNLIGATYSRELGPGGKLRWDLYYDQYRYQDRFDYQQEASEQTVEDYHTTAGGDWLDSQITYQFPAGKRVGMTLGAEFDHEFTNLQYDFANVSQPQDQSRISRPDQLYALFAQQEWQIAPRWKAYIGLRFDSSRNFSNSLSPRLALVYEPSKKMVYKFVYGRPFRNPSTYEQFYQDGGRSEVLPGPLRPETAHTFEVTAERKLPHSLTGILSVYHYSLRDLIQGVFLSQGVMQFQNAARARTAGVEAELSGKPVPWLEATASWAFQQARVDQGSGWLPDSPSHVGKFRMSVPLARSRIRLSGAFQYLSSRATLSGSPVDPVTLAEATASTTHLHPQFDLVFGVRNALNQKFDEPVGIAIDRLRADGRSLFVKLIWHARAD